MLKEVVFQLFDTYYPDKTLLNDFILLLKIC